MRSPPLLALSSICCVQSRQHSAAVVYISFVYISRRRGRKRSPSRLRRVRPHYDIHSYILNLLAKTVGATAKQPLLWKKKELRRMQH